MRRSKFIVFLLSFSLLFSPCFAGDKASVLDPIRKDFYDRKVKELKFGFQTQLSEIYSSYFSSTSRKSVSDRQAEQYFIKNPKYSKDTFESFCNDFFDSVFHPLKNSFKNVLSLGEIPFEESAGSLVIKAGLSGSVTGTIIYYAATAYFARQVAWWASVPVISSVLTYLGYTAAAGPPGWLIAAAVALGSGIYLLYKLLSGPSKDDLAEVIEKSLAGQADKWEEFRVQAEKSFAVVAEQAAKKEADQAVSGTVIAQIILFTSSARITLFKDGFILREFPTDYDNTWDFSGVTEVRYRYDDGIRIRDIPIVSRNFARWRQSSPVGIRWLRGN